MADIKHLLGDLPGHYICTFDPENVASVLQKALAFNHRTQGRKHMTELGLENHRVAHKLINIYNKVVGQKC